MMIKAVLFDYAGVLTPTRDNYKFARRNYKRFGLKPLELMHKTYQNWNKAVIGEITDKQFWQDVSNELNIDPEQLKNLIIETFPIDKRIVELIDKIKDRYTIVMVSNQVEDWLKRVIDDHRLRDSFHYFVNSYHVKAKKPNSEIFLAALEVAGSKPEETLFIDDALENIESAKKLGLNTIQFKNYNQFLKEFKNYIDI